MGAQIPSVSFLMGWTHSPYATLLPRPSHVQGLQLPEVAEHITDRSRKLWQAITWAQIEDVAMGTTHV